MTAVNLLPPELRGRERTRRLAAAVVAGSMMVVALLGVVYVLQMTKLSEAEKQLQAQQGENAGLQTKIAGLQRFAELKQQLAERQALSDSVLQKQVLWSGVLRDVSMVIPGQMYLTSMTASAAGSGGETESSSTSTATSSTAVTPGADLVGTIQFQGVAADQRTVALWLTRLEEVKGWANAWVSSTSKSSLSGADVIQFSATVDLGSKATVNGRPD